MAAAFDALNPLSMTFFSACGSASIAAAAMPSAASATSMRARYGARNGSSAASGRSVFALGRSVDSAFTELEFAQVQFPPHAEIAGQAVERVTKRRRTVALEAEMPEPRERIARQRRRREPPSFAGAQARRDTEDRAPRAD